MKFEEVNRGSSERIILLFTIDLGAVVVVVVVFFLVDWEKLKCMVWLLSIGYRTWKIMQPLHGLSK